MKRAEKYRHYAAECVRVAQQITILSDKAMLLDIAEKWRSLAEKAKVDADSDEGGQPFRLKADSDSDRLRTAFR